MHAEAMIFLDTESSGRYFDVLTYNEKAFSTLQELLSLCQFARGANVRVRNETPFPYYPAKGKLVSLHISIYTVDQNGAHGILQISPSEYTIFRSSDELERLISRASSGALKRLLRKANGRCITSQNSTETAYPC